MQGTQVEVASFGKSTSGKLKEVADDFVDLGDDHKKYLMGHRKTRAKTTRPRKK